MQPSVNESGENFTATERGIRFGLLAIKNLGRNLIDRLVCEREQNGQYTSIYDFCLRNCGRELNRRALEGLIKSGAMDALADNRRQMIYNIDKILSIAENENRISSGGQLGLFGEAEETVDFKLEEMDEMPYSQLLALEKEANGLYLSGHPMDEYSDIY